MRVDIGVQLMKYWRTQRAAAKPGSVAKILSSPKWCAFDNRRSVKRPCGQER